MNETQGSTPSLMEAFQQVLPHLNHLLAVDIAVGLCDREKIIFAKPGRGIDLNVPVGSPVQPGTAVERAMRENKRILTQVGKEVYGVPFIGVAIPLHDANGRVIGAACTQEALTRHEQIKDMSTHLHSSLEQVAGNAEKIAAQTEEISAISRTLVDMTDQSNQRVQESDQVLHLIRSIASQTNLLGLNAAIEAARVGEQGRGFGVVAEEIRKLATTSAESINQIEDIMKTIQKDSKSSHGQIQAIGSSIQEIAQAVSSVTASIQELTSLSSKLDTLSDIDDR